MSIFTTLSRYLSKPIEQSARDKRVAAVLQNAESILVALNEQQRHAERDRQEKAAARRMEHQTDIEQNLIARDMLRTSRTLNFVTAFAALFAFLSAAGVVWSVWEARQATIEGNRAWLGIPELGHGELKSGKPLYIQLRVADTGREPVVRGAWKFHVFAAKYINEPSTEIANPPLAQNSVCNSTMVAPVGEGIAIFPAEGINDWIPYATAGFEQPAVDSAANETKSLIVEGCFAYWTGNDVHKTGFRFILRDAIGVSPNEWKFNQVPSGNFAD